jgi:hypothetical protein
MKNVIANGYRVDIDKIEWVSKYVYKEMNTG